MSIVVVDSKWAWSIPVGGFIANILLGGFAKSFGIIISEFETLFDSPTAYFTLAGGLIYTFMYTLSLPAHLLSEKIGVRLVIFLGGIGSCLSIVGAAYAPGILIWLLCIGLGLGISLSLINAPVFITVGRAFVRQMGKANGLSVAGVSVGQIVFPYIVTAVINDYTVRGACLVGGALLLHFLLAGALMPRHLVATNAEMDKMIKAKIEKRRQKALVQSTAFENDKSLSANFGPTAMDEGKLQEERSRNVSTSSNIVTQRQGSHGRTKMSKDIEKRSSHGLHRSLFIAFVVLKVLADVADIALALVLPGFGKTDCKFSDSQISLALSIAGGVDLVTRLLVGLLSDRPGVRRSGILLAAYIIEAFAAFLFTFTGSSYAVYVLAYALFGAASGTAVTLMVVVLSDFVSPKNLPRAFAIMMLVVGCFIGVGQFVVGLIKDVTKNYQWSLRLCGFLLVIASVLMCLEYPIRWWYGRWQEKEMALLTNGQFDSHELDPMKEEEGGVGVESSGVHIVMAEPSKTYALEKSISTLSRATSADLAHSRDSI